MAESEVKRRSKGRRKDARGLEQRQKSAKTDSDKWRKSAKRAAAKCERGAPAAGFAVPPGAPAALSPGTASRRSGYSPSLSSPQTGPDSGRHADHRTFAGLAEPERWGWSAVRATWGGGVARLTAGASDWPEGGVLGCPPAGPLPTKAEPEGSQLERAEPGRRSWKGAGPGARGAPGGLGAPGAASK